MAKMNPVVHFEMPYRDRQRVARFYAKAFGWRMVKLGNKMGGYVTAATAETDRRRMVKRPGAINGGFYPLKSAPRARCPSVVIAVEDIKNAMKKILRAGGRVLGEPVEILGIGKYVSFTDSEGNRASVLQPNEM